jgi:hypothetical protein
MSEHTANPYQKARKDLIANIYEDMVGPESENELLTEAPSTRYSAGIIFPREERQNTEVEVERSLAAGDTKPMDDEEADGLIEQTSSFYPSAMGLSFIASQNCGKLSLTLTTARYTKIETSDYPVSVPVQQHLILPEDDYLTEYLDYSDGRLILKKPITREERDKLAEIVKDDRPIKNGIYRVAGFSEQGWKRLPLSFELDIDITKPHSEYKIEGEHLTVFITSKRAGEADNLICTVTAVNTETAAHQLDNDKSYFQVAISIKGNEDKEPFHPFSEAAPPLGSDPEDGSLQLLYRKKKFYAAGHGTSATWKANANGDRASVISTDSLPSHTISEMDFDLPAGGKEIPNLSMRHLAFDDTDLILKSLESLLGAYEVWIAGLDKEADNLDENLESAATDHINQCRQAAKRINTGIELLKQDKDVLHSFRLANKAMLMQRVHSLIQSERHYGDENFNLKPEYKSDKHKWRPFQIAFILLNLQAISDPDSESRNLVDLIWFPTGGGKTEAYLGLTAFTIFMRRIKKTDSGGTTVLMRYTLRLLTSQQFQRACTLICACEKLRRDREVGGDPITIGQWLGSATSPNSLKEADDRIGELIRQRDGSGKNPFQILSCPWCGTYLVRKDGRGSFCYEIRRNPKRFVMWCANHNCEFSNELPITIVDEDVYRNPPTLLFGTVDKFAMLTWKAEASSIFALNSDNHNPAPELIIQDELHLISGSLGTMVGLYESAIDLLCSRKGVRPKIIASTATIRRSKDQCRGLYARDVRQFPAPGLDAADSFFAREAEISDKRPGRMYIGVMPSGKTSTTMQIRLLADCIQGAALLNSDDTVKDKYWTQVVYCNSIRELGTSKSIIYDDVKEYSKRLADRMGVEPRYYSDNAVEELTSRIPAETIPEILQRLETEYPSDDAIDVLLATNMISVGVDINRLGLMMILGQPKTTSEYIQASSRVGRSFPGLVVTLYSPVKSRDRSHFEQFRKYHQALYRYVEPTSVTPFSPPVRNKALHAVVITLIRHMLGYAKNDSLSAFDSASDGANEIVQELTKRVNIIDSTEAEPTAKEIRLILDRIEELREQDAGISYDNLAGSEKIPLLRRLGDKGRGEYAAPQSMRSTDAECYVTMDYSE